LIARVSRFPTYVVNAEPFHQIPAHLCTKPHFCRNLAFLQSLFVSTARFRLDSSNILLSPSLTSYSSYTFLSACFQLTQQPAQLNHDHVARQHARQSLQRLRVTNPRQDIL
jgi:hypothetical protein